MPASQAQEVFLMQAPESRLLTAQMQENALASAPHCSWIHLCNEEAEKAWAWALSSNLASPLF